MAITTNDVFVNINEDEDCGTLNELKHIHGKEFNIADYQLSTPAGTAMLFEQGVQFPIKIK